ncbi:MAG: sulfite exporter TauE/SafE family protein [Bacteroidetes bacterium]|nr:sulfite exporter TauE/SafE family protein [Bacteroidota bacterium]
MSTTTIILLLIIGLGAGMLGSMVGIGGGIVVVPALLAMTPLLPSMNPTMAAGTSLAMLLPPIGILGVIQYYKAGQIDFRIAGLLCLGFIVGAFFGGKIATSIDKETMKKFFAIFLLLISLKFLFFDKAPAKAKTTTTEQAQTK